MKLLFPLAMTFLALTCLAIAIPAPRPQSLQLPPDKPCYDVACIRDARQQDSVVEPKEKLNLLRMAILAPRGGHGRRLEDLVVEPKKEQNSLRMDLVPSKKGPTVRNNDPKCETDEDCNERRYCSYFKWCHYYPEFRPKCDSDSDCVGEEYCSSHTCIH